MTLSRKKAIELVILAIDKTKIMCLEAQKVRKIRNSGQQRRNLYTYSSSVIEKSIVQIYLVQKNSSIFLCDTLVKTLNMREAPMHAHISLDT